MSRFHQTLALVATTSNSKVASKTQLTQFRSIQLARQSNNVSPTAPSASKLTESKLCRDLREARERLALDTTQETVARPSTFSSTFSRAVLKNSVATSKTQISRIHNNNLAPLGSTLSKSEEPISIVPESKIYRELRQARERLTAQTSQEMMFGHSTVTNSIRKPLSCSVSLPRTQIARMHNISLRSLCDTLHTPATKEPELQVHGLKLHDTSSPTTAQDSKVCSELRKVKERETSEAVSRVVREIRARTKTMRNLGIWEVNVGVLKRGTEKVVASEKIAEADSAKESGSTKGNEAGEKGLAVGMGVGMKSGMSQVSLESRGMLCAADLDNIYC